MSQIASNKNSQPQEPDTLTGENAGSDNGLTGEAPRFVAPTHGGVDILKLLTELEDVVEGCRRGPLRTLIGFDEDRFHMTVMKIRANLPEEMKRASKLARDSERIVEETQMRAERVLEDARAEAVRTRTEAHNELEGARRQREEAVQEALAQSRREAELIIAEAREAAARLVADSDIVQAAQIEAQEVLERARRDAEETLRHAEGESHGVRRGADDYARDVLANLEGVLSKAALQVQRGREMLEQR